MSVWVEFGFRLWRIRKSKESLAHPAFSGTRMRARRVKHQTCVYANDESPQMGRNLRRVLRTKFGPLGTEKDEEI